MKGKLMERLDQYMAYAGLNDNRLTVLSGLTVGIINSARKRKKGMASDNIEKILMACKDLNARWLLTGEGEMLDAEPAQLGSGENQFLKNQNKELMEKIDKLNRELGDMERQIIELKKERAQHLMAAESADAVPYGLAK